MKSVRSARPNAETNVPTVITDIGCAERVRQLGDTRTAAMRRPVIYKFRLYTADGTQDSVQALANLTAMCRAHLPGQHEIEVVDIFREPQRALADGIRMTPTLVRLAPAPIRRIVGTLSQNRRILELLGLEALAV